MNRALRSLALLLLLLAPLGAQADDNTVKAKEHYLQGQTHYALGEFGEAVSEFREAYRLRNEPAILYNIAQAMRQLGNYKQAYFYYSQYLSRKPEASNRSEVEGFMEAMHKKMEADEEVERARAHAEAVRPAPPKSPDDHLEQAETNAPSKPPAAGKGATATLVPPPEVRAPAVAAKGAPPAGKAAAASSASALPPVPGQQVAAVNKPAASRSSPLAAPAEERPTPRAGGKPGEGVAVGAAPVEAVQAVAAASPAPSGGWATPAHVAGVSVLGAGAVAGALAFVFHGSAQAASDTLDQKYAAGTLTPADSQLKDDVKSKGQLATLSAIGAAALLVTGAALTFVF